MNAPIRLSRLVSALAITVAGYALWRILIARAWHSAVDFDADALHLAAGIAAAGLVSTWAHTLPRAAWTAVFAAGAAYRR